MFRSICFDSGGLVDMVKKNLNGPAPINLFFPLEYTLVRKIMLTGPITSGLLPAQSAAMLGDKVNNFFNNVPSIIAHGSSETAQGHLAVLGKEKGNPIHNIYHPKEHTTPTHLDIYSNNIIMNI